METRWATQNDIETLVQLRVDFLHTQRDFSAGAAQRLAAALRPYYQKHLQNGTLAALIAHEGSTPVATAFLIYYEYLPGEQNPGPVRAMLANVFTYPAYRGRGLAGQLCSALTQHAKEKGAVCIDLFATGEGKPVYEKLGYKPTKDLAMRLTF